MTNLELATKLRESADEVMAFPHPSQCDHLHEAYRLMREAADVLQYGNCSHWCPACLADIAEPKQAAAASSPAPEQQGSGIAGVPKRVAGAEQQSNGGGNG